jgi:hypothetical protein
MQRWILYLPGPGMSQTKHKLDRSSSAYYRISEREDFCLGSQVEFCKIILDRSPDFCKIGQVCLYSNMVPA